MYSARPGQPLQNHLRHVARRAQEFAADFKADKWAHMAGLWHDAGKYSRQFQKKLVEQSNARVDHSTAGAKAVASRFSHAGKILAYIIAGHHAGLPDGKSNDDAPHAGVWIETYRQRRQHPSQCGSPVT